MRPNKVLIIDDSEANLYLVQSIFVGNPCFEVRLESDSAKALQIIRDFKPELILLDLMMPDLDGFQLLMAIREDIHIRETPVMVVSAYESSEAAHKAESLGVLAFIKKPVNLSHIRALVLNFFAKKGKNIMF